MSPACTKLVGTPSSMPVPAVRTVRGVSGPRLWSALLMVVRVGTFDDPMRFSADPLRETQEFEATREALRRAVAQGETIERSEPPKPVTRRRGLRRRARRLPEFDAHGARLNSDGQAPIAEHPRKSRFAGVHVGGVDLSHLSREHAPGIGRADVHHGVVR